MYKNNAQVSIIIPIYNVEKYISKCIESVINQTFKDIEIICVDDGSTDNSIKIIRQNFDDNRITILKHDKNCGLGAARNTGINYARGNYIFFLDSDDYVLPETIEKLYNKIKSIKTDFVVIKAKAFADDDSTETVRRTENMNKWLNDLSIDKYEVTLDNYIESIQNLNCVAWGKLFSTEFIKKNHLKFIENGILFEDGGFWLKVCSCFPAISYIDYTGLMYRIRKNAISSLMNSIKNHNKVRKHSMLNIEDAFSFFDTYKKEYSDDLKNKIKNSTSYCSFFETRIGFLFRCRWLRNNKIIAIFSIPIFRERIKNNNILYRVCGLCIFKRKVIK